MALPPVDMVNSCCKKERCLSGVNIGQVYEICDPCKGLGAFNEETCDCEDLTCSPDVFPDDFSNGLITHFTYSGWTYCGETSGVCNDWQLGTVVNSVTETTSANDPVESVSITSITPTGNPVNLNGCNSGQKQRQAVTVTYDVTMCSGSVFTHTVNLNTNVGDELTVDIGGWDYTISGAGGDYVYPNQPADYVCT